MNESRHRIGPGAHRLPRARAHLVPARAAVAGAVAGVVVVAVLGGGPAAQGAVRGTTGATAKTNVTSTTSSIPNGIVVKLAAGHSLTEVTNAFPVTTQSALLTSRGIYLMRPSNAADRATAAAETTLSNRIATSKAVAYAEPNYATTLNSSRYRSWPEGAPTPTSSGSNGWLTQSASTSLQLATAHNYSQGLGVKVAVLDTGVDPTAPVLQGRLKGGYDYIDDDSTPTDVRENVDTNGNGTVDDAYGHGTFVAGLVALVAPDALIMPYRVLDSDGVGNVYIVAQAILDAAAAGASVINLSFGTDQPVESRTLGDAIASVEAGGVIVVAAAGNSASTTQTYPAADPGVLSVSSTTGTTLSTWANRGPWVQVAAPGDSVVGPVPGAGYAIWSGTSMATPFVAGQVALVRAMHRTSSATAIVAAVTSTAIPLSGTAKGMINVLASLTAPGS